jgi:hypothetical protein
MRRIVVSRYNRRCMWIRQSSRSHVAEDVQFRFDRGWRRLRRRNPDRREFGFCAPSTSHWPAVQAFSPTIYTNGVRVPVERDH